MWFIVNSLLQGANYSTPPETVDIFFKCSSLKCSHHISRLDTEKADDQLSFYMVQLF
jgi:hypothetical protein